VRGILASLLALVALLASSCGGGGENKPLTKAEYEKELGTMFRELQGKTLPGVLTVSPAAREGAVRRLKDAEATLRGDATKLAEMKPPADAAGPTSQIASAIKEIAGRVSEARKDAEDGNFGRLEQFKVQIASDPAVAQIRDAVVRLVNLGYDVAGPGP
jgi:hypothetical protein